MTNDQMREAFEAKFPSARGDRWGSGYAHQRNQDRWLGWQAAYAAGMERAAKTCESIDAGLMRENDLDGAIAAENCADAIRAEIPKEGV